MIKTTVLTILFLTTTTAHAAIQCQTTGKSWRLIDGRKCWHDSYRRIPKERLTWARKPVALHTPATNPAPRVRPAPAIELPPAPADESPMLAALRARAEAIRLAPRNEGITILQARNDNPAPPEPEVKVIPVKPVRVVLPAPVAETVVPKTVPAPPPPVKAVEPELPRISMLMTMILIALLFGQASIAGISEDEYHELFQS